MSFEKAYTPAKYEGDIYALWEKSGAFTPKKDAQNPYTIVMPPPNANGNLHIGHGLTIALEDILTRYHRLKGDATWYIPGADHAGFETWVVFERFLEQKGQTRFNFSRDELYQKVWDFVDKQRGNMEQQLRALGASCDWSSLTFTLDQNVVDTVYQTFARLLQDGLIYRDNKLVNFCTKHQTAFADIEVVHKEEQGTLWQIAYPLLHPTKHYTELIVATTRPETLFGDVAVAVNQQDKRYKNIIGQEVKLPLTNRTIPIIADEHADPHYGTGVVKITPAHDYDDFTVGKRHELPLITVIGFDGKMTANAGQDFCGLTATQARQKALTLLKNQGLLRGETSLTHTVGHCYKCDTIIEPLLREQWFINVKPLATRAITALEQGKIKFYPANKKRVLIHYLKNLQDWNISRQIPWGIPIPAFQNLDNKADWIFDPRVDQKEITVHGHTYRRDDDTFDTWFSSGQWPFITTLSRPKHYPLDVMETGADLLFQWVGRMIMLGLYVTDDVPFRAVYLHGMVLDARGQKMSKSKGNVINPIDLVAKYGSDALRLGLIASRSAGVNQAFSDAKVIASRNLANKLWNIARFIDSLTAAEPLTQQAASTKNSPQPTAKMLSLQNDSPAEAWIFHHLRRGAKELARLIERYRFAEAGDYLYDLIWNKYADWYLEATKSNPNLAALQTSFKNILILAHPFLPFVTEAIWQNLHFTSGLLINQSWPNVFPRSARADVEAMDELITVTSAIRSHFQSIQNAKQYPIFFLSDPVLNRYHTLVARLAGAKSLSLVSPQNAHGLRLSLHRHTLFFDLPDELLASHKKKLTSTITQVEAEITTLKHRLDNPNYLQKAPAALVEESKTTLKDKQDFLKRLKAELQAIS